MTRQQPEPDDYVLAAGEQHTARELAQFAFAEIDSLLGDATKARNKFGWRHKTSFAELVRDMVHPDLKLYRNSHGGR